MKNENMTEIRICDKCLDENKETARLEIQSGVYLYLCWPCWNAHMMRRIEWNKSAAKNMRFKIMRFPKPKIEMKNKIEGMTPREKAALEMAQSLTRLLSCDSKSLASEINDAPVEAGPEVDTPQKVRDQVPKSVRNSKKEHFLAFYLDSRNHIITFETVSIGTLSASLVHPREVFAPAILAHAAAIIVVHNHPSGDCSPSPEDKSATRRLRESGELLGIPLIDHLIVSRFPACFSFRESGLLS